MPRSPGGDPASCPAASGSGPRSPVPSRSTRACSILDEPVSALDAASRDRVVRSLIRLRDERRDSLGMLVISHDIGSLAALSDRLVVLYRGRIVEDGLTRQVVRAPQHPYTRLLISSVPLIGVEAPDREERASLRALVDA